MLKKDRIFRLGEELKNAIRQLKQRLTTFPVLNQFNPDRDTELHTDASLECYGAIMLQKNSVDQQLHLVYYYTVDIRHRTRRNTQALDYKH